MEDLFEVGGTNQRGILITSKEKTKKICNTVAVCVFDFFLCHVEVGYQSPPVKHWVWEMSGMSM